MPKVSAVIIAHNEEDRISQCLKSVRWADEIIVVDAYSNDNTVNICQMFGASVIQRRWQGHINQKNFAISQAINDWVFSLDADEVASPKLTVEIRDIMSSGKIKQSGFYIPRQTSYLGRWIRHCGWYPDFKLRLFNRRRGYWAGEDPHDSVVCKGKTSRLDGNIYHYSFTDGISSHLDTINRYTGIAAVQRCKKGKKAKWFDLFLRAPLTFFKLYIIKQGFLDGVPGLIICTLSSFHVFVKYAKLWELANVTAKSNAKNK